jgi:t-SNARE complex subunit (syntaxin)
MEKFNDTIAKQEIETIENLTKDLEQLFNTDEKDLIKLQEYHDKITSKIDEYFAYLKRTGKDHEKSYICKLINENKTRHLLLDVYHFLHHDRMKSY